MDERCGQQLDNKLLSLQNKGELENNKKFSMLLKNIWQHRLIYLILLPGFVYLILFRYVPMYGITLAFKDINLSEGLYGGTWVGFKYFKELFVSSMFISAFKNTIVLSLLRMITTNLVVPVLLAVFMNEITSEWYKRTLQTAIYMPRFVSWIVYGGIVTLLLSPESGVVNAIIKAMGGQPIYFLSKPEYFKAILLISDMLKEAGWGAVIFIAAISSVDVQQYEAAIVDGASKLQKIWHITLPGIANTIVIMFVIKIGYLMSVGVDMVYSMYNPLVFNTGDVIDTFVLRTGIQEGNISSGTAADLFKALVGLVLVIITNKLSKRFSESSLL